MNKSYSKIRHIRESNLKLERRILKEQQSNTEIFDKAYFEKNPKGKMTVDNYGFAETINGIEVSDYEKQFADYFTQGDGFGRGFNAGDKNFEYEYKIVKTMRKPEGEYVISIKNLDGSSSAMFFLK